MKTSSVKFAFVFFLAITSVMSMEAVPDVEAEKLAAEEAPYVLLNREGSSAEEGPQKYTFKCDRSRCQIICTIRCFCIC
ncbi:hypothetical protein N665_1115s0005 [Sinapis alba]|nr:hypothetical protein N665_1115s0005 [Sinapis alba]